MTFTGINHICVATRDLDRAVAAWADGYGVGPWRVWTKDASNMHASPQFAMRVALAELPSGARIELIEPLDDRSPYAESLARHGGADHVHHVRFDVADYAAARLALERMGHEPVLDATFDGAEGVTSQVRATYLSTVDDLGLLVELADVPPDFAMPAPERTYP